MAARIHSIFDRAILSQAVVDAFKKLYPLYMLKNPVMFVTEVGAALTTLR
jgi:K+-transporting ATPase ATPase B chain